MRKFVIGFVALLVVAGIASGVFFARRTPPPEPSAAAVVPMPAAPLPAPTAATQPAAPKRSDLPTVEVQARIIHTVPEGEPPPAKPVTLRSRDGRVIDPASGRYR